MRARRAAVAIALTVGAVAIAVVATLTIAPADPVRPAFTTAETVSRIHHNSDGTETVADTRNVTVSVDKVSGLRGNQLINVSWSGAHPTLGRAANPNSAAATFTEYPVVLMQCRGDDTPAAPLDPGRCWTQTIDERKHETSDPYPAWRTDRYATAADRAAAVGYPDPRPAGCSPPTQPVARYVPFVAADGTVYRPLTGHTRDLNCGKVLASEMVTVEQPDAPPGNTTYGVTDAHGDGHAAFVVLSEAENSSLGCSTTVKCSLVVIPIAGTSCDSTGVSSDLVSSADANCRATGKNQPDTLLPTASEFYVDLSVTGLLWWSASNWRGRITVPLNFDAGSFACAATDDRAPVDLFGSELMAGATSQWAPAFCADPTKFKFRHVRLGEPQAAGVVAAGAGKLAMISFAPPDGYPQPTVNAPIAVSGFAISYAIDDAAHNEYTNLRLAPRLIAKLLTESYPGNGDLRAAYARAPASNPYSAMAHNPYDLSTDPEFIALNPGLGNHSGNSAPTSSTLLTLSGTSDVIHALSLYLNADPEARAWLNGTPDPWGMVVNPGYRNIELPVTVWPLLDTFTDPDVTLYGACLAPEVWHQITPQPIGPLVASPVPFLSTTAQRVHYANSNSHTRCQLVTDSNGATVGADLGAAGRQTAGFRFMLAVTALADANFLQLHTAALQSHAVIADPAAKFTDATGRDFVAPSVNSMKAAVSLAVPDETTGTWQIPYAALRTDPGQDAYPGTMVVYASVPTRGLAASDATDLAQFLRFAAGPGQQPGASFGQLPTGYLPMTADDGLALFVSYTLRAADAVAAQDGELPGLVAPTSTTPAVPRAATATTNRSVTAQRPAPGPAQRTAPTPSQTVITFPSTSPTPAPPQSLRSTAPLTSALAGWALPVALLTGVGFAGAGLLTRGAVAIRRRRR